MGPKLFGYDLDGRRKLIMFSIYRFHGERCFVHGEIDDGKFRDFVR